MASLRSALRLAEAEASKIQKEEDEKAGVVHDPPAPPPVMKRKKLVTFKGDRGDDSSSDESKSGNVSSESEDSDDEEAWCRKQLGYGADLYKDNKDRDKIERMSEMEREMKLYERSEKRRKLLDTFRLRQTKKRQAKAQKTVKGKRIGKGRKGKLSNQKVESRKKKPRYDDSEDDISISSMSDSDEESDEFVEEENRSEKKTGSKRGSKKASEDLQIQFEDVKKMQITRDMLVNWVDEPFFEQVIGGFVRLGIGADPQTPDRIVYRMCEIEAITKTNVAYAVEKRKKVDKQLLLRHGRDKREFRIEVISNGVLDETEFLAWRATMLKSRRKIPTKSDAEAYVKRISDTVKNYVYSESDVLRKVQRQKEIRNKPVNITSEKEELKRRIKYFKEKGELDKVKPLQDQLERVTKEFNAVLEKKNQSAKRLDTINARNKAKNIDALTDIYAARTAKALSGEKNPYTRQACRPRLLWATRKKAEENDPDAGDKANQKDDENVVKDVDELTKERIEQASALSKKRAAAAAASAKLHEDAFKKAEEYQRAEVKPKVVVASATTRSYVPRPKKGVQKVSLEEYLRRINEAR